MRRIDELHLQYPFAGARMLRDLLRQEGHAIGRRQVATLMRRMGITAMYRKPTDQSTASSPPDLPVSAASADDHATESCVGGRYYVHSDATRLRLSAVPSSTGRVAECWPGGSPTR